MQWLRRKRYPDEDRNVLMVSAANGSRAMANAVIGVEYVRHWLQADISKNELQLAGERDRLRREGYDVGRKLNRGLGI
jgi:hypothetical protein